MDTKYTEHNLQTVYGVVNAQIKICPISIAWCKDSSQD